MNRVAVDIGGQERTTGLVYLTIARFLRHNLIIRAIRPMSPAEIENFRALSDEGQQKRGGCLSALAQ